VDKFAVTKAVGSVGSSSGKSPAPAVGSKRVVALGGGGSTPPSK
jgi:hypothetical protein